MKIEKIFRFLAAGLAALLLVGCSQSAVDDGKTTYVVTVGMLADLVEALAGEEVVVQRMMSAGVDPHLYKPTLEDTRMLQGADAIFYVGLHLEGQIGSVLDSMSQRGIPVFAAAEQLPQEQLLFESQREADPHVWMDVQAWAEVANVVRDQLIDLNPRASGAIMERAAALQVELASLHSYVAKVMATVPEEKRILITAHDAFGYFGRAYDLDVKGIQGLSTESEAGLLHLNKLVEEIVSAKIQAVFVESTVADKNVKALIEGAAAKGQVVGVGGELFSDAMGTPGTYEGTYIGMIDHNATTIARALGGEAPVAGMQGSLRTHE